MMKCLIAVFILLSINPIRSEGQKLQPETIISFDFSPIHSFFPATGYGLTLGRHSFFNEKWVFAYNVGFEYFNGFVINSFTKDTIKNISQMPILAGAEYYIRPGIYTGLQLGILKTFGHNLGVLPILAPELGFMIPKIKYKIGVSFQLVRVLQMASFPENSLLQKGGYSLGVFRLKYYW